MRHYEPAHVVPFWNSVRAMPDPNANRVCGKAKGPEDVIVEQTILHAVSTPTSTIEHDLLVEDLWIETDCVI